MIKRPLFSTINDVIFPNSTTVFTIGRDFSVSAVKEAIAKFDGELMIATQKTISLDKPEIENIHKTACLCKITNCIELPDGKIKFSAFAEKRLSLDQLIEIDHVRFGAGELFSESTKPNTISPERKNKIIQHILSLKLDLDEEEYAEFENLKSANDDFSFIMSLGHILRHTQIKMRELSVEEMNKGVFILDVLTDDEKKSINKGMAQLHEILESKDFNLSVQKIEKLLEAN